jgi:exodeoxyribonuclease VII large subunit
MKTYSLHELNEFLRRVIALNFNEALWVTAEIGQINNVRGHHYLDLLQKEGKDIVAQMQAAIWAPDYRRIITKLGSATEGVLTAGMEIRLKGRLDFHERFGLKLIIEEIDATFTIGKLEIQRQQLIAELKKRGLIGRNAMLPLPSVIQRLAVISSETAAGWQDFKKHIQHNDYGYGFDIQFFQSAMQGSLVEKMLLQQLDNIRENQKEFDCVIIIRGGGAKLDLVAFDTPSVCEVTARFPLPVFTGIGHEIDQTVLDMVAHTSLKTPTAVADFILNHNARFESDVIDVENFIRYYTKNRLNTEGGYLNKTEDFLKFKTQSTLQSQHYLLDHLQNQLQKDGQNALKFEKIKIENLQKTFHLMSIETTLRRGFSITKVKNKVLTTINETKEGDEMETFLADGKVISTISSISK